MFLSVGASFFREGGFFFRDAAFCGREAGAAMVFMAEEEKCGCADCRRGMLECGHGRRVRHGRFVRAGTGKTGVDIEPCRGGVRSGFPLFPERPGFAGYRERKRLLIIL